MNDLKTYWFYQRIVELIIRTFQFINADLGPINGDIPETHKEKRKWVRQKEKQLGQKETKWLGQKETKWLRQIFFVNNLRPINRILIGLRLSTKKICLSHFLSFCPSYFFFCPSFFSFCLTHFLFSLWVSGISPFIGPRSTSMNWKVRMINSAISC